MPDGTTSSAIQFTADGCFINTAVAFRAEDGSLYHLEWTPTLNKKALPQPKCLALAEKCDLRGGGWQAPLPHELVTLVDYDKRDPATFAELAEDTRADWYWTRKPLTLDDGASSSGYAWVVDFGGGGVGYARVGYGGFVRACRRVPPRQG